MKTFDVAIIGGGPSALSAAMYCQTAPPKPLDTVVIADTIGGQIKHTPQLENYLGLDPLGVDGYELILNAYNQAVKFGTDFIQGYCIDIIDFGSEKVVIYEQDGKRKSIFCRSVVLATGLQARKLPVLDGAYNVTYGRADISKLKGANVCVIGAGNSAGQFAVSASEVARKVTLVVRRDALQYKMSQYLIDRIDRAPNIEVKMECEVSKADTPYVKLTNGDEVFADHIAVFAGYTTATDWLPQTIEKDRLGFVHVNQRLETSMEGVYAIGDVKSDPVKRVGAAVGDGSRVGAYISEYLHTETKAAA